MRELGIGLEGEGRIDREKRRSKICGVCIVVMFGRGDRFDLVEDAYGLGESAGDMAALDIDNRLRCRI